MRQLTSAQKKLLDKTLKNNPEIRECDDLPDEVWDMIVELNDTEILYDEVNKYIRQKDL